MVKPKSLLLVDIFLFKVTFLIKYGHLSQFWEFILTVMYVRGWKQFWVKKIYKGHIKYVEVERACITGKNTDC